MRSVKALIPVRAGSQRVKNKNIRPFAGSSLLKIKIEQLKRIPGIDEIIVNSDCQDMLKIASSCGVTSQLRDAKYASSTIPMNDVWCHLAESTHCDDILYTNCTNPLVKDESYIKALDMYPGIRAGTHAYDSLTTVNVVREYLWSGDSAVNYDPANHPRSQDLPAYHALNFAISIIPRDLMIKNKSILGNKFFQQVISDIEAIDIDTLDDFLIAESAYLKSATPKP